MKLTHAGAVSYRIDRNRICFLVVSSSTGEHWVLPKGHIEPGETADAAALRELREEAGVIGEVVKPLAIQSFKKPGEWVVAQYYLVRALKETQAVEKRAVQWVDEPTALHLLSFEEAHKALVEGASHIPENQAR